MVFPKNSTYPAAAVGFTLLGMWVTCPLAPFNSSISSWCKRDSTVFISIKHMQIRFTHKFQEFNFLRLDHALQWIIINTHRAGGVVGEARGPKGHPTIQHARSSCYLALIWLLPSHPHKGGVGWSLTHSQLSSIVFPTSIPGSGLNLHIVLLELPSLSSEYPCTCWALHTAVEIMSAYKKNCTIPSHLWFTSQLGAIWS